MKNNPVFYLLASLFFLTLPLYGENRTPSTTELLDSLDRLIDRKGEFHARRNEELQRLAKQFYYARGWNRVALGKEILSGYVHFQTDSAQAYLQRLAALPEVRTDTKEQTFLSIAQAEIWAVNGYYADAERMLSAVSPEFISSDYPDIRLYYYRVRRTLNGWCADFTHTEVLRKRYGDRAMAYRDSLIVTEDSNEGRDVVRADKAVQEGKPLEAVRLLTPYVKNLNPSQPVPYVCFTLYQAYEKAGERDSALYFLTLTAIADMQRAITEYQALPLLAEALAERGLTERAYRYILCSMEDAAYCKARLRSIEASGAFPIIDKKYKEVERQLAQRTRVVIVVLSVLLLFVGVFLVFVFLHVKKLRHLRRTEAETNCRLAEANERGRMAVEELTRTSEELKTTYAALRLTDKMKEEYIARYLDRCRGYIDALENYRRTSLRLIKEYKQDELIKMLKKESTIKEEQEKFFADFDESFLTLFPDFIERFNALLPPEAKQIPKAGAKLNTELRIFALIRLGVTDTARIAHFLNFSMATVYNYRSKLRNLSYCGAADFERMVGEL